jgi:choline dehydrogenase
LLGVKSSRAASREFADYIVVGGGSAGSAVAGTLARLRAGNVLLLECGGPYGGWRHEMPGAAHLISDRRPDVAGQWTAPQDALGGRRVLTLRGNALGGTSSINGMIYLWSHPAVFRAWATQGAVGWGPERAQSGYRSLERVQHSTQGMRGTDGPLRVSRPSYLHEVSAAFIAAARAAGHPWSDDLNSLTPDGVGVLESTCEDGTRQSAARAFLCGDVRPRIQLRARVTRLLIDSGRCSGVEYVTRDGASKVHASRGVILCAGAFGSPAILLRSGIGPARELEALGLRTTVDSPGVGRNLQDHVRVHLRYALSTDLSLSRAFSPLRMAIAGLEWFAHRRGPAAESGFQTAAFWRSPEAQYPDIQCLLLPVLFDDGWRVDRHQPGFTLSVTLVAPASTGVVKLASADPAAEPIIDPGYLSAPGDSSRLADALRTADDIAAAEPLRCAGARRLFPHDVLHDSAAGARYVRVRADSSPHYAGTCRMGMDASSVVDDKGRVHGVEGVWVADASVMPRVVNVNTNATVMMVACEIAKTIANGP